MEKNQRAGGLMMLGGLLLAVGSALPWLTVDGLPELDTSGLEGGDGWITLVAGVVLVGLGYQAYRRASYPKWLAWVAFVIGSGVMAINFVDIQDAIDTIGIGSQGIGMWLMITGSIAGIVGILMAPKVAAAPAPPPAADGA